MRGLRRNRRIGEALMVLLKHMGFNCIVGKFETRADPELVYPAPSKLRRVKEAAEKVVVGCREIPQGLKPDAFSTTCGMTEVMP